MAPRTVWVSVTRVMSTIAALVAARKLRKLSWRGEGDAMRTTHTFTFGEAGAGGVEFRPRGTW